MKKKKYLHSKDEPEKIKIVNYLRTESSKLNCLFFLCFQFKSNLYKKLQGGMYNYLTLIPLFYMYSKIPKKIVIGGMKAIKEKNEQIHFIITG